MFKSNPFAEMSALIPPSMMQTYVIVMILLVIGGTLYDINHKKSAKYFFENWRKSKSQGSKPVDSGKMRSIAVQTAMHDVLASGEFCNPKRRVAHLLTMYGFLLYVISTVVLVFAYPTSVEAGLWPFLWTLGALMICIGGYWFWFFIRADVAAEGNSPFRVMRADLFILSLLASATLALVWALLQSMESPWTTTAFVLYVIASTVLFGSVAWSKFSHMFFKPAAALQKRVAVANGTLDNLPEPADRTDPATRNRHSMELLKDAPLDMGLGIKREQPHHY